MRKMLLTLTTVGVLAVPAGMAFAQTDPVEPTEPVPTCVDPVQNRDRDRASSGEQARRQLRTQQQLQLDDGTCDADCTGDQTRLRDRSSIADGSGVDAEFGRGDPGRAATDRGNGYRNN